MILEYSNLAAVRFWIFLMFYYLAFLLGKLNFYG